VGVLVLVVVLSWCLGAFSQQPVAGVQGHGMNYNRRYFCRPAPPKPDPAAHFIAGITSLTGDKSFNSLSRL
jgi:hypothetical protein